MKSINKERLQEIVDETIPFPLLFLDDVNSENPKIIKVLSVEDISDEFNSLGVPEYIDIVLEDSNGHKTYAEYELINSYREYVTSENADYEN